MLYIFLDCDGVINNKQTFLEMAKTRKETGIHSDPIDEKNMSILADFIHKHNAKVVLSSSWRAGLNDDLTPEYPDGGCARLLKTLKENNIELVGKTDRLYDPDYWERANEILKYVEDNLSSDDNFIIFDDDDVYGEGRESDREKIDRHFVKTSFETGLTEEHILKAERFLNNN